LCLLLQAFPHTSAISLALCVDSPDFYELLVNDVRTAYHCGVAGAVWGLGAGVAVVAGGRAAGRWARRRCDEALAGARRLPRPSERSFVLVTGLGDRPPDRARVRDQRALQQALDIERRGGAFLARRATPPVQPHAGPDRRR
jgi:hypothetical protein